MWLRKLFKTTDKSDINPPQEFFIELSKVNPKKFYVENVRSVLDITFDEASKICEEGVSAGAFVRGFEILCPDNTVAKAIDEGEDIPEIVECWEEIDGDLEPIEYESEKLNRRTYYRYK